MEKKKRKSWIGRIGILTVLAGAACLGLFLVFGGRSRSDSPASGGDRALPEIVVGCDDYSPFSYMDVDGDLTGIDVELAEEAFRRMGYQPKFVFINWEDKKNLLEDGTIDCIWSSFTMDGREEEYRWAGPYMTSHQVIAVNPDSRISSLQDLENKTVAVQSTTKPEDLFRTHDLGLPELRRVISVQKRDLIFVMLSKGYVDAIAAHDTAVEQFMSETGMEFRILEEPLLTVRLGVAFDRSDARGLDRKLSDTLEEMRADGTTRTIVGKYFADADRYLGELDEE